MNLNVFLSSIRNNPWVTPVTVMALILGALLALSLKTQQTIRSASLPSNRFSGLAAAYRDQQEQLKMANEEISKLRERTTQYENEMASASEKARLLNEALQEAKFLAGLTPVEGPGVEVILQDSKKRPPPNSPIDIENYIIHDSDLQRVVNELHAAGAEAVAVNGERIIANTAIRCVGPTVQINGIALSSPYVIHAIGDPDTLANALNLPQGVLADIQALDPNMVKVTKKAKLVIPAYTGSLVFRYAKPASSNASGTTREEGEELSMNWLPVLALLVGFLVFYFTPLQLPSDYAPYLSLATLSGLDSILGGIRAGIEGKFHVDVFVSGFIFNTLLAALLAYLGDQIGVDLFLAAVVTLGGRMFLNLSLIRRYYLTQWSISRQRDTERT